QAEAPHGVGPVGNARVSAVQRKTAEHRRASGFEDTCFRKSDAIAVALEESGNADSLGVIATKAGVKAVGLLEPVSEPRRRQLIATDPTAEVGEGSSGRRECKADQG